MIRCARNPGGCAIGKHPLGSDGENRVSTFDGGPIRDFEIRLGPVFFAVTPCNLFGASLAQRGGTQLASIEWRGAVHFLVIDHRYTTPIFVFLERDTSDVGNLELGGRWVTLEPANFSETGATRASSLLGSGAAVGGDPNRPDRFAIFTSEGQLRAAGYSLIEPRYMGPSWDTYLSVFHPEGGKQSPASHSRTRAMR